VRAGILALIAQYPDRISLNQRNDISVDALYLLLGPPGSIRKIDDKWQGKNREKLPTQIAPGNDPSFSISPAYFLLHIIFSAG